tara:strand:- start:372 stop:578 length:207 start_codon:yes stop_codon:yes gene_type:complete
MSLNRSDTLRIQKIKEKLVILENSIKKVNRNIVKVMINHTETLSPIFKLRKSERMKKVLKPGHGYKMK